ncbi:hypothetical protein BDV32DRAFT_34293 [Aspergillus pseudonomiae]|uniref:Uncharacterized protein n=1 Tax=Aspergillus pseudonomiae TaxID=1506151 RepID=A0A5N7DHI7_9EURO|nr:uncharacterized protein BDV37DRAFT_86240 [Aspergillus pseudonomiae]KAB8265630.1 hypothetical protein BDV32DRAFT_34293 [Aspergillus pseudonomiae]KAE8405675.1 hypothetical protein BDV37DRAFT_86240 [Aspergillus pseudonomiae]
MMLLQYLFLICTLAFLAVANVEKTIFIAPQPLTIPTVDPTLDDLGLDRLSPSSPVLRTRINATFPTNESPGTDSWYFLENLNPGQRYEVRVCWLATEPTVFTLATHTLPQAIDNPALFSSISLYSQAHLASPQSNAVPRKLSSFHDQAPTSDSVLFLRVTAAADYFSLNKTLMENVPPVAADIILDPFLWNIFPQSLVPTACYIFVVGCLAVVIGWWVLGELGRVVDYMNSQHPDDKKDK